MSRILEIEDTVELLTSDPSERPEKFSHERAIRLFQFQTWIWFPSQKLYAPKAAGQLAAATFLHDIERERFASKGPTRKRSFVTLGRLKTLMQDEEYSGLFNGIIAPLGGWSDLRNTVDADEFSKRFNTRLARAEPIPDLVDYLLRCSQHRPEKGDIANISHAVFFRWWPRREEKKWLTPRTLFTWWKTLRPSAAFIYADQKGDFRQYPRAFDDEFIDGLIAEAEDVAHLRNFFGHAAYVSETVPALTKVPIAFPPWLERIRGETNAFSDSDQRAIDDYAKNYLAMSDSKMATESD
jgi:hypothetical protein